MNIFNEFEQKIKELLQHSDIKTKDGSPLDLSRMSIEAPRDPSHGDLATNAAMVLSKSVGCNPRALAERIATLLETDKDIESVNVAGPGFINLRLTDGFWRNVLKTIIKSGSSFGRSELGLGKKVNVEYVSANPTGPMHVGHCRGAVVGDVLANLLSFTGHDVVKEYYINDAGGQIDVLAKSVFLRYREALGENIGKIPDGLYPGDYLVPVGEALKKEFGDKLLTMSEEERLPLIKERSVDAMMRMIRDDLAALNVHHDVFFSEKTLHADNAKAIRSTINDLTLKGYVYKGTLPPPKGQASEDWEDREQTLFRSTDVGDDQDRPLIKSDGSYTYFAADVAYFRNKFERRFNEMIYVLGADHGGYVKRLQAVAKAISGGKAKLTALLCQLVKLLRDGQPVVMSKRAGSFVTLRDVVDEVGRDPVRFMMIYRKSDAPLDFDFAKVTEQSKDNPVFYVQYACARCHSTFRKAEELLNLSNFSREELISHLEKLTDAGEIALIKKLAEYPRVVEQATLNYEPHRLAFYLYDLASFFHGHWNKGTENEDLRFIKLNDRELSLARLGLIQAVSDVLSSALGIIGVDAPVEMR
ncbi:arginine--tRNA ligase [Bartonella apis]|uniref:arginine--tRNA ligase n=1 Tax=Bartonella apis TaxID=1686310 RepID=UPI00243211FB|nr:arginine--tRNA ligase [Bartonella apis]MCT6823582.1 arginine--tRNA ligase [Bartonella apis]MCT6859907.1 arginine--tRNA ligase [Bartonella apis]MCT6887132.1 arginine--tRNA ligase [Bartonella apis]